MKKLIFFYWLCLCCFLSNSIRAGFIDLGNPYLSILDKEVVEKLITGEKNILRLNQKFINALKGQSDKSTKITVRELKPGALSKKIFLIRLENPSALFEDSSFKGPFKTYFILKEFQDRRELANLTYLQKIPFKPSKNSFQIAFSENVFASFDHRYSSFFKREPLYFGIFHGASGASLHHYLMDSSFSCENMKTLFAQLGRALARFHLKNMIIDSQDLTAQEDAFHYLSPLARKRAVYSWLRTVVHGDLHMGNLFYDEKKGFSFIDPETLVYSLSQKKSVLYDLERLITYGVLESYKSQLDQPLFKNKKVNECLQNFLSCYIEEMLSSPRLTFLMKKQLLAMVTYLLKEQYIIRDVKRDSEFQNDLIECASPRYTLKAYNKFLENMNLRDYFMYSFTSKARKFLDDIYKEVFCYVVMRPTSKVKAATTIQKAYRAFAKSQKTP